MDEVFDRGVFDALDDGAAAEGFDVGLLGGVADYAVDCAAFGGEDAGYVTGDLLGEVGLVFMLWCL